MIKNKKKLTQRPCTEQHHNNSMKSCGSKLTNIISSIPATTPHTTEIAFIHSRGHYIYISRYSPKHAFTIHIPTLEGYSFKSDYFEKH